ncbi:SRPBCC family protein [Cecembia rubra]|uniref:SRPBCC family protein n=1 Tax=Cecembia rubra TaxID=1485585 RepID=UPI00271468D0|nr:SRPBCC domain-containing protein [Cecembia rubra]
MESIEQINYIKAPVETVYKALTTMEGLGQVWTKKLNVKPEIGFINEFDFDEGYLTKMRVIVLEEYTKIAWECIASDKEWIGTVISFDLSEKEDTTTVVLRHYNWKELTDFYRWCNYNWAMFLFSLKNYCENQIGLPYQDRIF